MYINRSTILTALMSLSSITSALVREVPASDLNLQARVALLLYHAGNTGGERQRKPEKVAKTKQIQISVRTGRFIHNVGDGGRDICTTGWKDDGTRWLSKTLDCAEAPVNTYPCINSDQLTETLLVVISVPSVHPKRTEFPTYAIGMRLQMM
ncbi:hypothetical protein BJ878DRAFT_514894 [Calycina marina]|uniref:Uncharacterized protein n=1 Tax=Calycina marina TaxID=1763456 RepID=A0A9P8CD13_9HELO|nr:hypothetical protein BJ878DRAFT_514894 [Calycina marina]